jgi:spoIIIJ-associated protein
MKYTKEVLRPKLEEFLKPALAHAGFNLSFELKTPENPHPEVENPEVTVHFSGPDVELLLENRAELLLALEHLSMEALRLPPEDHSLISFDANDYRLLRMEELRMSALAAADKVKKTHAPFFFNPMSSRERRVIHLALRDEKELRSESVGVGATRAVVLVPADMATPPAPPVAPRPFQGGARPPGRGGFDRGGGGQRGGPPGHGGGGHRGAGGNRPPRGGRGR